MLITSVEVNLRIGSATFPRCEAYVTPSGRLIVQSLDTGDVAQPYEAGCWRDVNVRDEHGTLVDSFFSRVPHHPLPTDIKPADLTSHVFDTAAILARMGDRR